MKRCLICLTKPHDKSCVDCQKRFCEECSYPFASLTDDRARICIKCFRARKLHIISKREGMTFKQFCYKAREIAPQGYLSTQVQCDNFRGGAETKITFVVYHENYGHSSADTPEDALREFQIRIRNKGKTAPTLEDINI